MSKDESTREQAIREHGGRETYILALLEDIREALSEINGGNSGLQSGTLKTISSYKSLPEAPCNCVVLHNANEELLRWRLAEESGIGNPLPPGHTISIPVSDTSDVEVRGSEKGMDAAWIAQG
jgi:hypothetical protein